MLLKDLHMKKYSWIQFDEKTHPLNAVFPFKMLLFIDLLSKYAHFE